MFSVGVEKKRVRFSEQTTIHTELSDHVELLKIYRCCDLAQRTADRCRQQRLLDPILDKKHRENILELLLRWCDEDRQT